MIEAIIVQSYSSFDTISFGDRKAAPQVQLETKIYPVTSRLLVNQSEIYLKVIAIDFVFVVQCHSQ